MEKKNTKILAVDDSTTNIILLEGILEEIGYRTETAPNAKDALKMITADPPDLILLDLMMPRISGYKLLEKIRNMDKVKHIPIVIVSAKTDAKSIKMAMDLGATDYIKKPIDIQNFIDRIEAILAKNA